MNRHRSTPPRTPVRHRARRTGRRWVGLAAVIGAALAGFTVLASSASAHDAPPTGSASCESYGTTNTWQVADGKTRVENTGGAAWKVTFATSAGTIIGAANSTGTGDTANGPGFTVTGIASTVASIQVTTTTHWGTAPSYTTGSYDISATIARPAGGCNQSVPVPAAPSVSAPTCSVPGSLTVPADTASVTWTTSPNYSSGDTGNFTLTATAQSGSVFSDGKTVETYPVTVAPKTTGNTCDVLVAPVVPTVTEAICTGPGTHSSATLVIPTTLGVTYKIAGQDVSGQSITETPGTSVTVTATPHPGYLFAGAVQHIDYDESFTNAGACLLNATPVAPTLTDGACTTPGQHSDGTLTIPNTSHVIYQINGTGPDLSGQTLSEAVGSTVTVVATPASGYQFTGAQSVSTVVNFTNPGSCTVTATPLNPSINQARCTGLGTNSHASLLIPTTTGVLYQIAGKNVAGVIAETGATTVVVTALPVTGYAFGSTATTSWTVDYAKIDGCLVGTTVATPSFSNHQCSSANPTGATYTIASTNNVTYNVNGSPVTPGTHTATDGSTITVTATADKGYSLGSATKSWTHTFSKTPLCEQTAAQTTHKPANAHTPAQSALASTGVHTMTLLLGGLVILTLGTGLLLASGVRGRKHRTQVNS